MAPLTKDMLEVSNESAISHGAPARPAGGQMRADALSLEVPVKIHGSRVKEVVRGVTPHTEPFEEQSSTMIVFPQGAVLRMATAVNVGQMLVVTNIKTRQDAICRVVKVRSNANLQGYIEVEFTHRQPGYWGVHFPSEGPAPANKVVASSSPASTIAEPKPRPAAPEIFHAPATSPLPKPSPVAPQPFVAPPVAHVPASVPAPVVPPATAAKPDSPFIAIGTQEKVQPAASATVTTKPSALSTDSRATPSTFADVPVIPLPPAAPSATLSMAELRGDQETDDSDLAAALSAGSSGSLAGSSASAGLNALDEKFAPAAVEEEKESEGVAQSHHAAISSSRASVESPEVFGGNLDSSMAASESEAAEPRQNWMLVAAGIALLFVAGAGGVMFFRSRPAHPATKTAANISSAASPVSPNSAASSPSESGASVVVHANAAPASVKSPVGTQPKNSAGVAAETRPAGKQPATGFTKAVMSASLAAHPVSSRHAADVSDAAPAIDTSAAASDSPAGLPGVIPSPGSISVPAPAIRPAGPVKIGGLVKEPKLASYVSPVYPQVARAVGVEGDVVLRTTIDKNGRVTNVQVVSGPSMLRQPAEAALRRWKYEPSKLDGQAVSVQLLVTIKFRR